MKSINKSNNVRKQAAIKAWSTRRVKAQALTNRALKAWETRKTQQIKECVKSFNMRCAGIKAWATRTKNQSLQTA